MPKELSSPRDNGEQSTEMQVYGPESIDGVNDETADYIRRLSPAELAGLVARSLLAASREPAQESLLAKLASGESLGYSGGATAVDQALRAEWLSRVVRTIAGEDAVVIRKDEDA